MTEKINGQGLRSADTAQTRRSEAAKQTNGPARQQSPAAKSSASSADTVHITQSGLLMSKLEELVQRAPVVDSERVAALKDAIASGSYEIDNQRVADRLLRFERDVLG